MLTAVILTFVVGYAAIAFEHPLKINKTASALLTGVLIWTIYALYAVTTGNVDYHLVVEELSHHLGSIAEILVFLMGAMTIVELVDAHQGFKVITNRITTRDARTLLWVIAWVTFFLSSVLDNLTTTIVMVSLLRRLVHDKTQRMFYVGLVVIAANAGGAWTPIGDVTTTMLWIGGQITTGSIMTSLFIPSVACLLIPLIAISFRLRGQVERSPYDVEAAKSVERVKGSMLMFFLGVGALLFVPIFKTVTHLPPWMGMMFGLSVVWIASEILHVDKTEEERKPYTAVHALSRIDVASVLFFLGILVAISGLESLQVLSSLATTLDERIGNLDVIVVVIGIASAIIDNVPLVAAAMGMYPLASTLVNPEIYTLALASPQLVQDGTIVVEGARYFLVDAKLWEFLAYAAGTGGSMLIIGSAAGVAAMGMENINFIWYLKRITLYAALGYFAGVVVYLAIYPLLGH
jgi:Na+/H+ antiporter NhaD/arsenite permease-like protein